MMSTRTTVMAQSERSRARPDRRRGLLLSLVCSLGLSGCAGGLRLPNLLYLATSTNSDQEINAELISDFNARLNSIVGGYRQLHPATRFQFGIYPEKQIVTSISRRNDAGLGPDLLFINGDTAKRLVDQGLADPFPFNRALENLFNPEDLRRMRTDTGALAGLPILVQTQVACYNRTRLPEPPNTLQDLLSASARGHSIGLSIELEALFWSAGSVGAIEAIERSTAGTPLTANELKSIENWLAWLQNANNQQRITFYASQSSALQQFSAGQLDWILCSSINLPGLRKRLGDSLGVASLPTGPGGQPSPVNRLRVLALGRSSSQDGRERALSFSRYSVNPLVQRNLTLGSHTVLPANRFVQVPVQSSQVLQAMSASRSAGQRTAGMVGLLHDNDPRINRAQNLINELVFGEVSPHRAANDLVHLLRQQP
jgi:arabinogalactan oligomer/maltooligosaccharide transport system substrate-binding protein